MQNSNEKNRQTPMGFVTLGAIILAALICLFFLLQKFGDGKHVSIFETAQKPEEIVESIKRLSSAERSDRIKLEVDALIRDPLNTDAINNIAILESLGNTPKKSETIIVEASRRSLRDVQLQLSAVNILLSKSEFDQAMFHIDGLLRARPKLREQLFQALTQIQQSPEARKSVASLLKTNPPWREEFLTSVFKSDVKGQASFQLLSEIRKSGGQITNEELRLLIETMMTNKNFEMAYFTWLDFLDDSALRSVSLLYDGTFDRTPQNQVFDWTIIRYPNANISISSKPGDESNRALRLDFLGGKDHFAHVQQSLRLSPGTYEISGEWRADNFQSPSGFQWQVYCHDGSSIVANSRQLAAASSWEKFSFNVTIPIDRCDTQLLQLKSSSSAVLDQKFDGQMYLDNIDVRLAKVTP